MVGVKKGMCGLHFGCCLGSSRRINQSLSAYQISRNEQLRSRVVVACINPNQCSLTVLLSHRYQNLLPKSEGASGGQNLGQNLMTSFSMRLNETTHEIRAVLSEVGIEQCMRT